MDAVWRLRLEGVAPHIDGEYELPPYFMDTITIGEWQEIKVASGVRRAEAWESLIQGDAAFQAALAVVFLRRVGKQLPLEILLALTPDAIQYMPPAPDPTVPEEAPDPTTSRPSGSGTRSSGSSESSADDLSLSGAPM